MKVPNMNSLVALGVRRESLLPAVALAFACGCGGSDFAAASELAPVGGGGAAPQTSGGGATAGTLAFHSSGAGGSGGSGGASAAAGAPASCRFSGVATAFASCTPDAAVTGGSCIAADGGPPSFAVDGDTATRWTSGAPQAAGQWFELDLQSPLELEQLTLQTSRATDLPTTLALKLDGQAVPATVTSSSGMLELAFTAQKATVVRLELEQTSTEWWSINELVGGCLQ